MTINIFIQGGTGVASTYASTFVPAVGDTIYFPNHGRISVKDRTYAISNDSVNLLCVPVGISHTFKIASSIPKLSDIEFDKELQKLY